MARNMSHHTHYLPVCHSINARVAALFCCFYFSKAETKTHAHNSFRIMHFFDKFTDFFFHYAIRFTNLFRCIHNLIHINHNVWWRIKRKVNHNSKSVSNMSKRLKTINGCILSFSRCVRKFAKFSVKQKIIQCSKVTIMRHAGNVFRWVLNHFFLRWWIHAERN